LAKLEQCNKSGFSDPTTITINFITSPFVYGLKQFLHKLWL